MRVFVSYRRDDSPARAGRLADALRQELGDGNVFQDVAAIEAGEDFTQAIDRAVDECDAVLVVIGPDWRSPAAPRSGGTPDGDVDYVQVEVAAGLAKELKVVPVLVGGANMPQVGDLPDDLRPLLHRQAVVLHDETWHQDVVAFTRSLRGESRSTARSIGRPMVISLVAIIVVAVTIAAWQFGGGGDDTTTDPEFPPCESRAEAPWVRMTDLEPTAGAAIGSLDVSVVHGHYRRLESAGTWEVVLDTTLETRETEATHGHWLYESLLVDGFAFPSKTCFAAEQDTVDVLSPRSSGAVGFEVSRDPAGEVELIVEDGGIRGAIVVTTD